MTENIFDLSVELLRDLIDVAPLFLVLIFVFNLVCYFLYGRD